MKARKERPTLGLLVATRCAGVCDRLVLLVVDEIILDLLGLSSLGHCASMTRKK